MNNDDREDALTLEILESIENQSNVTQRHLADNLGVALGLTNSYLKRCVHKGFVKIQQIPANRYLYYLTPKGFAEKSRLTTLYLSRSFDFYRHASDSLASIYISCHENNFQRILFCGISELAEIASIRAREHNIQIVGTIDPDSNLKHFLGLPVWQVFEDTIVCDGCILTTLEKIEQRYDFLISKMDKGKIMVPSILGMNLKRAE